MSYLNNHSKKSVKETLSQYKKNEIKARTAIRRLFKIIEFNTNEDEIKEALNIIEEIDPMELPIINMLSIRDNNEKQRIYFKVIMENYLEKGQSYLNYYFDKRFLDRGDYSDIIEERINKHRENLLKLVEFYGFDVFPKAVVMETAEAIKKVKQIFEEKNIKKVRIERKYLLEMFNENIFEINENEWEPTLVNYAKLKFRLEGINIKYKKDTIIFSKT